METPTLATKGQEMQAIWNRAGYALMRGDRSEAEVLTIRLYNMVSPLKPETEVYIRNAFADHADWYVIGVLQYLRRYHTFKAEWN